MSGIIPQETVEQVRTATDIVEIIGQFVRLKKRGRNFTALCPFHAEKTPSFSVSPERQIFHCFGCGKGGNVFTFLMEHEKMSFVETVRHLAQKAGIRIVEKKGDDRSREEIEKLHYAQVVAREYFRQTLYADKYREPVLRYLHEKRRLTDQAVEFFQIGLAGEEWDGFLNYALKKDLFLPELIQAGLIIHSEKHDKYFDRFRQRLMIPIFNLSDRPIAFGGRALKSGEPAKYVNSPETPLYSKSNVLYGLNFTRQSIREKNEVIIVEGYFDLISLYQAGLKNVVASSGTAFTPAQARLLARFADTAFLFFDSDSAGQNAALRSIDALYDAGLEVKVMIPPPGDDPDSLTKREGLEGLMRIYGGARTFLQFRTEGIDIKQSGLIAKEKLIKELAELAAKINDPTRRELFLNEASERLGLSRDLFRSAAGGKSSPTRKIPDIKPPKKIAEIERDLLALVMRYPEHLEAVRQKLHFEDFQEESWRKIFSVMLTLITQYETISESALIDLLDDTELKIKITSLAALDFPVTDPALMIKDHVNLLLKFKLERIIDTRKAELKVAEEKGDSDKARELEAEILDLIKRREN